MSTDTKDKLIENSQASLLEGMLRGGVAGGIAGGTLLALPTGIYSLTTPNPRLDKKEQMKYSLQNSAVLGNIGLLGGAAIGSGAGLVSTIIKRLSAARKLEQIARLENLEKQGSATDYLIGGLSGAGIGGAAGALMNVALGKKLTSPGLILGGAGLGGAVGLGIGHLKSREREIVNKNAKSREACVERDEKGNIKMFDFDGNEVHKENGLWVTSDGKVVEDQNDVGPRPMQGMYVGNFEHVNFLQFAPGGEGLDGKVPILDNTTGHACTYVLFDKPREFTLHDGDKKVKVCTMKGPRGTNVLKFELAVDTMDMGGGPKDDRKGLGRILPYQANIVAINDIVVNDIDHETGKPRPGFSSKGLQHVRNMHRKGDFHFLRAWDDTPPTDKKNFVNWQYMNLFPIHDPKKGMSLKDADRLASRFLGDAYLRKGELELYNVLPPNPWVYEGAPNQPITTCNTFATGMASVANDVGDVKSNPEFTPYAPSVIHGGKMKGNDTAKRVFKWKPDASLFEAGDVTS